MTGPKLSVATDSARAVATQALNTMNHLGYDAPYDRERLIQEMRFYMDRSARTLLEMGRRLLVIKENEPHGEFLSILKDRIGVPARTAQRMMQVTAKYLLNPKLNDKLPQLERLGWTKLLATVSACDDDLIVLVEGGTLAGHTFDDIECMTSNELRIALREAREEGEAKTHLLADIGATKANRATAEIADDRFNEWLREATSIGGEAVSILRGRLRQALAALHGQDAERATPFASVLVSHVVADCRALIAEFDLDEIGQNDETSWGGRRTRQPRRTQRNDRLLSGSRRACRIGRRPRVRD